MKIAAVPESNQLRIAFGNTIRSLRQEAGMAQEQLAALCRIERAYMSQIERGLCNPTLLTIYKLLPHLRVTLTEFAAQLERQIGQRRRAA